MADAAPNGQATLDEAAHETNVDDLREAIDQRDDTIELIYERLAELELALEDEGWTRLGLEGQREFSRHGLGRIIAMARLMYRKNPLIRRAVNVRSYYVWGQGITVKARDDTVNNVVQRFLDDPGNRDELTGHQARMLKEVDLANDGNLFLVLFPSVVTGHVKIRSVPVDEIVDIHCNPQDRRERWYYERHWTETGLDASMGNKSPRQRKALYPDWRYAPANKPRVLNNVEIRWDSPIYHVRAGGLGSDRFGVPETYAALDWARAYKNFLEDWASLVRSLSRFAWRLTTKSSKVAATKAKVATTLGIGDQERNPPPPAGSAAVGDDAFRIEAIPKTGATTTAEDGRQLRLMVASAMDLPDTILAGDPDQGNLATAKTLDRPTELAMLTRQKTWADIWRDLLGFVVITHVRATRGLLSGTVDTDADGITTVKLDGDVDPSVDVTFPEILEHDMKAQIDALVMAATLDGKPEAGTIDRRTLVKLLLEVLGVDNIDELVDEIVDNMDADPTETEPQEAFVEAMRDLRQVLDKVKGRAA